MAYTHPANLTFRYLRYAQGLQCRMNIYQSQINMTAKGGNPCLISFHAGAWISGVDDVFSATRMGLLTTKLLDPTQGFLDPAWTVIGCEYRQGGYVPNGSGPPQSVARYRMDGARDIGRAIQYVKDNAQTYGINRDKIVSWGQSAGSCNGMINYLQGSLPFLPRYLSGGRWDRYSNSIQLAHLNWYGEVSCEDGDLYNPAGIANSFWGTIGTDFTEQALIPKAVQRAVSPTALCYARLPENVGKQIFSVYATSDAGSGGGHDPAQLPLLDAACRAAGIEHVANLIPTTSVADITSTVVPTIAWLNGVIGQTPARLGVQAPTF